MVDFVERNACLVCGSVDLKPIWSGSFDDPFVIGNLKEDGYKVDLAAELANRKFCRVSCQACGMSFHKYVLTDHHLRRLYSEWIDDTQIDQFENDYYGVGGSNTFDRCRKFVQHCLRLEAHFRTMPKGVKRILDYGCGDGGFLRVASLFGWDCYGVDFSTTRQARCRRRGLTQVFGSLAEWDALGVGPCHAVTVMDTLEHVPDPLRILRTLAQRMLYGGTLIIDVPNCGRLGVPSDRVTFEQLHPLEHINHFTPRTLELLAGRAGFKKRRQIPAYVTTRPVELLRTCFRRRTEYTWDAMYFSLVGPGGESKDL
jgi:2-polyprenyl-3-methyl-5-hydroxy-6-metoxy-1,4-benzoquinol methylase